jgi:plastocyanin
MQRPFSTLVFVAVALALQITEAAAQAVVEGKVQLPPTPAERASNQRYPSSGEVAPSPPEPCMAIVYLQGGFLPKAEPQSSSLVQMAQKNISFAPGLLAVQVGTTVEFPNLDDIYHNVFSYSKTKRFDLGRYRKDEKPGSVLFDKPGVVTTHCEVHEKMRGTVLVLETPYFQKTDSAGRYRLDHLPAGHYVLTAWISEKDVRTQQVDLKVNSTQRVDFPVK